LKQRKAEHLFKEKIWTLGTTY